MEKQTTHRRQPRGIQLEKDFAKFMEDELDFDETKLRELVNGNIAVRPYEVDIHGIRTNSFYKNLQMIGLISFIAAILAYMGIVPEIKQFFTSIVASFSPELAGSALLIFGIGGLLIGYYGKNRKGEHIWVECKDLKTNVKRTYVMKLVNSAEDVINNESADWQPTHFIMVSGSGFDQDAIGFAKEHEVDCYIRKGKSFETLK